MIISENDYIDTISNEQRPGEKIVTIENVLKDNNIKIKQFRRDENDEDLIFLDKKEKGSS